MCGPLDATHTAQATRDTRRVLGEARSAALAVDVGARSCSCCLAGGLIRKRVAGRVGCVRVWPVSDGLFCTCHLVAVEHVHSVCAYVVLLYRVYQKRRTDGALMTSCQRY